MKKQFDRGIPPEKLWERAARKKICTVNMSDVKHWIYSPCWSITDDHFISPYQVMMQPDKFPDHIARIDRADLTYPLIVVDDDYDKFGVILDGNHRFAKMIRGNKRVVKIVRFSKKEIAALM